MLHIQKLKGGSICLFLVIGFFSFFVSCQGSVSGRLTQPAKSSQRKKMSPPVCAAPAQQSKQKSVSDLTVLIYMQAKNNLSSFADKNLSDIAASGSNQNVTYAVQWFQPGKQGVWRYKIEQGKMVLDSSFPSESDGNKAKDLVDAARWAMKKYPAKKFALILWNHGVGILDPAWGNTRPPWQAGSSFMIDQSYVKDNPRISIEGLTTKELTQAHEMIDEHDDIMRQWQTEEFSDRGILFNEQSKTYMDNQNLTQALAEIKANVLGNKNISLLGMDACLMAMVEVGYLARKHVDYMVASQEVELANGWDYFNICKELSEKSLSSQALAQSIVRSYENFYKNKIQFYTQSAIDLGKMDELKRSLDALVSSVKVCSASDKTFVEESIRKARRSCLQFSAHSYIDLSSFCKEFGHLIDARKNKSKSVADVRKHISNVLKAVDTTVIANAVGKNLMDARGLSIYFPLSHIDSSYVKTEFALECSWIDLVKSNMR